MKSTTRSRRRPGCHRRQRRNIEDLRDLEKFDTAIQGIAERQHALEASQEKARQAWREHERRIRELEERLAQIGPISNAQRGHIYQFVHIWAQALSDRDQIPFSRAIASCWAVLKKRYDRSKYEHLPAAAYGDCVDFITRSYENSTGRATRSFTTNMVGAQSLLINGR